MREPRAAIETTDDDCRNRHASAHCDRTGRAVPAVRMVVARRTDGDRRDASQTVFPALCSRQAPLLAGGRGSRPGSGRRPVRAPRARRRRTKASRGRNRGWFPDRRQGVGDAMHAGNVLRTCDAGRARRFPASSCRRCRTAHRCLSIAAVGVLAACVLICANQVDVGTLRQRVVGAERNLMVLGVGLAATLRVDVAEAEQQRCRCLGT